MKRLLFFLLTGVLFILTSCASKKDVWYFQDAELNKTKNVEIPESRIQVNDILSINVMAEDQMAALPFNRSTGSTSGMVSSVEIIKLQGYLVSEDGMVIMPVLGKIEAKGKTISELENEIIEKLVSGKYLIDPLVNIRLLNSKVTVLGEVKSPGTYTFTEKQITLPQALGYAGDLTVNGQRQEVLVIREEDGKQTMTNIDMTSTNWFDSPYYYIKQNDIIYVKQNNAKVKSSGLIGNVGTVVGVVSVILSAIVIISR